MVTDVLTLVAPSPEFMASSYLASPQPGGNPTITYLSNPDSHGIQHLVYMKGLSGEPWDWMTAQQGSQWIYQRLTENIWTDPKSGKLAFGLGMKRLPRYIITDPSMSLSSVQWTMNSPETDYLIFGAGGTSITRNTDAGVRCTFRGPYPGAPIANLPSGIDWFEDYEWAGKLVNGVMIYGNKETVAHRVGLGRYSWSLSPSDGQGGYLKPTSVTLQTVITPLPAGKIIPQQGVF